VQGNERTRRQLIEKEMKAALKAKTHAELAKELVNANARLYDLDIFRDATCFVDAGERDEDVTVRVVVEEKGTHTVRKSIYFTSAHILTPHAYSCTRRHQNLHIHQNLHTNYSL
jgi:outer membrane protein assembly factor BamA